MGKLHSGFPMVVLRSIFSNSALLCLGNASGQEFAIDEDDDETTGTNYNSASGSAASWAFSTEDGRATAVNNGKVYWPEAAANYPAQVATLLIRGAFTDYDVEQDPRAAGYNERDARTPILYRFDTVNTALTVIPATRVKLNKYIAGANRGLKVQLWLPTGG